jgi:hypothetical protein
MTRRLLNLVTAQSLLLCVLSTALWVRSYSVRDQWSYRWREVKSDHDTFGAYGRTSLGGQVWIGYWWQDNTYLRRPHEGFTADTWRVGSVHQQGRHFDRPVGVDPRAWRFGFGSIWYVQAANGECSIIVPHWLLLGISAAPAASVVARRRWSRRRPEVPCPRCGYDLRATPGRCPECGTASAPGR